MYIIFILIVIVILSNHVVIFILRI